MTTQNTPRRRKVHYSDERSVAGARRRARYEYPGYANYSVRRVDPMTPNNGYVVTMTASAA